MRGPSYGLLGIQWSTEQPPCPDLEKDSVFGQENMVAIKLSWSSEETWIEP